MRVLLLTLLLAGCATAPQVQQCPASRYDAGWQDGYAYGLETGEKRALEELADSKAFRIPEEALEWFDDRDAFVKRMGVISLDHMDGAREREQWAKEQCEARLESAHGAIYRMIEAVRGN